MNAMFRTTIITLVGVLAGTGAPLAHADASLRSESQLRLALRVSPPCCVIDARTEAQRVARPLAEALVYRDDLRITPTATVIVVADTDSRALTVAQGLAAVHPGKTVFAVEGGIAAWEAAAGAIAGDPPGGRAFSFVIPKNTCEQAPPLQHLRTDPK